MDFLLRPYGGVWDLRREWEQKHYLAEGTLLLDFLVDRRAGGSWVRFPGVLAELGGCISLFSSVGVPGSSQRVRSGGTAGKVPRQRRWGWGLGCLPPVFI